MTTTTTNTTSLPAADRSSRFSRFSRFSRELGYLLSGLPLGIASFTAAVTGFSLGVGTLVIWLGIPVLAATLAASRYFADIERAQVAALTGRPLPPRPPRNAGLGLPALSDPQSWRDLTHAVLALPLRVITFSLAVAWTIGGLGELLYITWSWPIPRDGGEEGLLDLMFGIDSRGADIAFNTAIGVVLLATAIPMIRALTALQTALARALLNGGDGR
jgi:putative sensor protein